MAGLQIGRALECSGCLGLGSVVPAPHVPGHPTSICNEGVNFFCIKSCGNGTLLQEI